MNNKQLTVDLLHKYLKKLNNVKQDQKAGWVERYRAACPNHEAHNTHYKNGKIISTPNQNHKMKIGVVKSDNPEKFGEYMVTYIVVKNGV